MVRKYQGRQLEQFVQPANRDNRQKSEVLIKQDPRQGQILFHNLKIILSTVDCASFPKKDQPNRQLENTAYGVPSDFIFQSSACRDCHRPFSRFTRLINLDSLEWTANLSPNSRSRRCPIRSAVRIKKQDTVGKNKCPFRPGSSVLTMKRQYEQKTNTN